MGTIICSKCDKDLDTEKLTANFDKCYHCGADTYQNFKMKMQLNKIKEKETEHPAMYFLSDMFLLFSWLSIISGTIVLIYSFDDNNSIVLFYIILSTFISWLYFKFMSELCKIISDVATNVKLIRMISENEK